MKDGARHPDNLMIAREACILDQSPDLVRGLELDRQLHGVKRGDA